MSTVETAVIPGLYLIAFVAQSLFPMNEHAIANVYLGFSFLLRPMFLKNILLQTGLCA